MLSLYSWCRNVVDPHFIDIAHVGTPWRVGSREMNLINLMSLSFDMNPSSRKRIRSELSNSETEHVDDSTDDEGESKIEKVPRGIRGEKSSEDMASWRNLVSTIEELASPKMGDGTRCPEG